MSDAITELRRLRERITRCNDMHDVDAELRSRIAELEAAQQAEPGGRKHIVLIETVEETDHGEIHSAAAHSFQTEGEAHRFAVAAVSLNPRPKTITVARVIRTLSR